MPACKSLVSASVLARLKADPKYAQHVTITGESDYGDGVFLISVESEKALVGRYMQCIVLEEDGLRFIDDLDT